MKTQTSFRSLDRYYFDFEECSYDNGFAQVDTGQDAWYFGTWANPETLTIVCYCEGDVTRRTADDEAEFAAELREIKSWNEQHGHGFKGIDPGFGQEMRTRFEQLGVGDLLH